MKTQKIIALGLSAACVFSMLAGCGSKKNTDDNASVDIPVTVEQLHAANKPLNILQSYKTVAANVKSYDANGEQVYESDVQYQYDEQGRIQSSTYTHYLSTDDSGEANVYAGAQISDDIPGAFYIDDGSSHYMYTFPTAEYTDQAARLLEAWGDYGTESADSYSETDNIGSLTTKTQYEDSHDYYTTVYNFDTKTMLLESTDVTYFTENEDGNVEKKSSDHTTWTYDADLEDYGDASQASIGGDGEKCDVTITINPGKDSAEIQNFKVNKDTKLTFVSSQGYTMYADEALTETIDDGAIDVSGDTAKVYVVLGELTDDMKADDTASDAQNTDESK